MHAPTPAVLHVMRAGQRPILGVLQAITSDPFVEWTGGGHGGGFKPRTGRAKSNTGASGGATSNPRALAAMAGVRGRLQARCTFVTCKG